MSNSDMTASSTFRKYFAMRISGVLWLGCAMVAVIVLRSLWLVVSDEVQQLALQSRLPMEHTSKRAVPAHRGSLLDRRGMLLAADQPMYRIRVDRAALCRHDTQGRHDAHVLLPATLQLSKAQLSCSGQTVRLVQSQPMDANQAQQVLQQWRETAKPAVVKALWKVSDGYRRVYTAGASTGVVTGFIGYQGQGSAGAEGAYAQKMSGQTGVQWVRYGLHNRMIELLPNGHHSTDGDDQYLSIDMRLQDYAYRLALQAKQRHDAEHVVLMLADVRTGEILAMTQAPGFDAQFREHYQEGDEKNLMISAVYEPGSVMKPFFVAAALESGPWQPESQVLPDAMAREQDWKSYQQRGVPLSMALVHSHSGAIRALAASLKATPTLALIEKAGFANATAIFHPGRSSRFEPPGKVSALKSNGTSAMRWYQDYLNLSTGYAVMVTPLQLLSAYTIFATDGVLQPLSLQRGDHSHLRKRVISEKSAHQTRAMLAESVRRGTGKAAQLPNYPVAGKTGTARKLGSDGVYRDDQHASTFVGMAPANHPVFAALVWVDKPQGEYSASQVAAPVFARLMEMALHLYDIPPDQPVFEQLAMREQVQP